MHARHTTFRAVSVHEGSTGTVQGCQNGSGRLWEGSVTLRHPTGREGLRNMKTVALLAVWVAEAAAVATTNVRVLPPLPNFLSKSCDDLEEREAKLALSQMTRRTVRVMGDSVQGDTDVATTFWESSARPAAGRAEGLAARLVSRMREQPMLKTQPANTPASLVDGIARGLRQGLSGQAAPRVLLLHGADASILEWRFLVPRLNALGVDAVAVDWWSGGWTDREALLDQIDTTRPDAPQPWTVVRQHLHVSTAASHSPVAPLPMALLLRPRSPFVIRKRSAGLLAGSAQRRAGHRCGRLPRRRGGARLRGGPPGGCRRTRAPRRRR